MRLNDLKKAQRAKIVNIIANTELKLRLSSHGIIKNIEIKVDEISLGKSTVKISINNNMIALRAEEANAIEVDLINE